MNGWVSGDSGFGVIDDRLLHGNIVNPIFFTFIDKIDGDLDPMLVDFSVYTRFNLRRTELANKLANCSKIAIDNILVPCVPLYTADNGSDNPSLNPPLPHPRVPFPALSVSEAFRNVGIPVPILIRCPYHLIDLLLESLKLVKFTVGSIAELKTHLDNFTLNIFEKSAWMSLFAQLLSPANFFQKLAIFERVQLLQMMRSVPVLRNEFARFASFFAEFLIAIKGFIELLDKPMSLETVGDFLEVKAVFVAFSFLVPITSRTKKFIDALIINIDHYLMLYAKYRSPFRPCCMSTRPHYSWKYSYQATMGFTLAPSFKLNIGFIAEAFQGCAERLVFCEWGESVASILPRLPCFIPPASPASAITIPVNYQQHARSLQRVGFRRAAINDICFVLFAYKRAKELSAVVENQRICDYFSHPNVQRLENLIRLFEPYLNVVF